MFSFYLFTDTATCTIGLPILIKMLYPINDKWKAIGIQLGLNSEVLMQIEKRHKSQDGICLINVLDKWLKSDAEPTWTAVYKAVNSSQVGGNAVAAKILKEHEQALCI